MSNYVPFYSYDRALSKRKTRTINDWLFRCHGNVFDLSVKRYDAAEIEMTSHFLKEDKQLIS